MIIDQYGQQPALHQIIKDVGFAIEQTHIPYQQASVFLTFL